MSNDKKPTDIATKREWSAPKVTRRAQVDRTQGGAVTTTREFGIYYRPS